MFKTYKLPSYVEIVNNPYNDEDSECLEGLRVDGEWHSDIGKYIKKYQIKALYLNASTGWQVRDYSFLKDLQHLVELRILDAKMKNVSAIESLHNLKYLDICYFPNEYIDFRKLSQLKTCSLGYPYDIDTLFELNTLESLSLDELKLKDYRVFEKLTNLKKLYIGNSSISTLDVLSKMTLIEELSLINCRKISDFSQISLFKNLKYLDLRGCNKLVSIDFVSQLKNLEHLILGHSNTIKSIKPLKNCSSLRIVALPNIIDGDLSPLENLKKLNTIFIQNRKHYTHKCIKKCWDDPNTPEPLIKKIVRGRTR